MSRPPALPEENSLFAVLRPYAWWITLLTALTVAGSALNLAIPQLVKHAIDAYATHTLILSHTLLAFGGVAFGIFVFNNLQNIAQTVASERVARDLRNRVAAQISLQDYASVEALSPAKLLTNLTSDVDAVKNFVAQAIASIASSIFLIIGAAVLMLLLNWKLALAVLAVLPFIAGTFYFVLRRVRLLFRASQESIDRLNAVINESILGAALVRILNSTPEERDKFFTANSNARAIGMRILRMFASMIPTITFLTNLATFIILALGGYFVIEHTMTLGSFVAFNTYLGILIFPIIIIGFMSNVIAQAQASYARISTVLATEPRDRSGTRTSVLTGAIEVKDLSLSYGSTHVLKKVNFAIKPRTRTAIIGPTAAGKTQLLYLMTGLLEPTTGAVEYDGHMINEYDKQYFHSKIGFVFQDSVLFNLTLRENIAFSSTVKDEDLARAIDTAELHDFIAALPQGLDTVVSERGTSLSGGQKQRVMLARALALNPSILFLDDFTARVDTATEAKILGNVERNFPELTLISVTQKVASVEAYEQVILLMEGDVLGTGTHEELLHTNPEYVQIFESQKSTERYERE